MGGKGGFNKDVFLLDMKTYTWVTNFQAKPTASSAPPISSGDAPQVSNSLTVIVITASVVGSLVAIISGIAIVFFILKHKNNNSNNRNRQSYQNDQNRQSYLQDYQNDQEIIEIPSSSDMRFSPH